MYFTRPFWLLVLERALKTAAQSALIAWGSSAVGATTIDWKTSSTLLVSALAGFGISILTSIASAPVGNVASPSLITPQVVHVDNPGIGDL